MFNPLQNINSSYHTNISLFAIQMFNKGVIDFFTSVKKLEIISSTNERVYLLYAFFQQLTEEQYFEKPEVQNNKIGGKFSSIDLKQFSNVTCI